MNHIISKDYETLSRQAACIVAGELLQNPGTVLGLATGSTPVGLYRELVELHRQGLLDFSRATSFNLDEYCGVPRSDPNSYWAFMQEKLFGQINLPADCIRLPNGAAPDPEAECARYEAAIRAAGDVDLQVLGIGHNGHIGFNEPADAFADATHCVTLDQRTIQANARFYDSADAVPRRALTMGIGTIMRAKKVLLLVSGQEKRDILTQSLRGLVTPRVPASVLQLHNHLTVISDFPIT